MPYFECHIATGLTKARKTQLIRDIVKVTHESIGSDPKIINVLPLRGIEWVILA